MIDKGEDPDNSVRVKILSKVWLYVKKSVTLYAESWQEDEASKTEFRTQMSPPWFMIQTTYQIQVILMMGRVCEKFIYKLLLFSINSVHFAFVITNYEHIFFLTSLLSLPLIFGLQFHEGLSVTQQCHQAWDNVYWMYKWTSVSTWPFLDSDPVLGQGSWTKFCGSVSLSIKQNCNIIYPKSY